MTGRSALALWPIWVACMIFVIALVGAMAAVVPGFLPLALGGSVLIGLWGMSALKTYHLGRQRELSHLILTAVEANVPLAPVLRAYSDEHPRHPVAFALIAATVAALGLLFPPLIILVAWQWWHRFDPMVREMAYRLDLGDSPSRAAREVLGLLPAEMRIALRVGEATGRLPDSLRRAQSDAARETWTELLPRIAYPMLLLFFVGSITSFLAVAILPKFKRILDEFGLQPPPSTALLIGFCNTFGYWWDVIVASNLLGWPVVAWLLTRSGVLWRFPVVRRFYRAHWQGITLRMLGVALATGTPAPMSLRLLAEGAELPRTVRRRVGTAEARCEAGDALSTALRQAGLLPASMLSLVQSAQGSRTLPDALEQLGEHRSREALTTARRLSLLVTPISAVLIGTLVGFVAIAMFTPLTAILSGLSQ